MSRHHREWSVTRFLFGAGEGLRIAFDAIRVNPFRSGLTVLGVGIGVCVVVLMAGLIAGIRLSIQEGIEASGPRNFMVATWDMDDAQVVGDGSTPAFLLRPMFTVEEIDRIARVDGVDNVLTSFPVAGTGDDGRSRIRWNGIEIGGVQTTGQGSGWLAFNASEILDGRDFVDAEIHEARAVGLISEPLAADLFGDTPATGQRIRIDAGRGTGLPLTIVGVFQAPDQVFSENLTHQLVVPRTTAVRRLGATRELYDFFVAPAENRDQGEVEDAVIATLRTIRGLAPGEANNFSVIRATQLLELFDRFTGVFVIVMLALSSTGLLLGGVGVIGMMMISVTERTREIGIRKALGATRGEILWQFLVEAGALTLLGGAAGLLLGGGIAQLVAWLTPVPASVPLWAVAASLLSAAVTGMLFGLIPALRASRMLPVDALRFEQ